MKKGDKQRNHEKKPGGLFIPAGILLGMGFGFLIDDLVVGLFIGLGAGFLAFAISLFMTKK